MSSNDEPTDVQLDISKYEGHTPGPWRCVQDDYGTSVVVDTNVIAHVHFDEDKDALLIADAPLLLEEVKRLQRKLMLAESALGEIRAYHESGQGNLGEIIEHYQENEQVEMPNAFDED